MLLYLHGRPIYPVDQHGNYVFVKSKSPQKGQTMVPNEDNLSFASHCCVAEA